MSNQSSIQIQNSIDSEDNNFVEFSTQEYLDFVHSSLKIFDSHYDEWVEGGKGEEGEKWRTMTLSCGFKMRHEPFVAMSLQDVNFNNLRMSMGAKLKNILVVSVLSLFIIVIICFFGPRLSFWLANKKILVQSLILMSMLAILSENLHHFIWAFWVSVVIVLFMISAGNDEISREYSIILAFIIASSIFGYLSVFIPAGHSNSNRIEAITFKARLLLTVALIRSKTYNLNNGTYLQFQGFCLLITPVYLSLAAILSLAGLTNAKLNHLMWETRSLQTADLGLTTVESIRDDYSVEDATYKDKLPAQWLLKVLRDFKCQTESPSLENVINQNPEEIQWILERTLGLCLGEPIALKKPDQPDDHAALYFYTDKWFRAILHLEDLKQYLKESGLNPWLSEIHPNGAYLYINPVEKRKQIRVGAEAHDSNGETSGETYLLAINATHPSAGVTIQTTGFMASQASKAYRSRQRKSVAQSVRSAFNNEFAALK